MEVKVTLKLDLDIIQGTSDEEILEIVRRRILQFVDVDTPMYEIFGEDGIKIDK